MKSLKFAYKYLRKYSGVLILTVISMLLLVGVQLLAPWIVKQMISTATDADVVQRDFDQITKFALLALSAYVLRPQLYGTCSWVERGRGCPL